MGRYIRSRLITAIPVFFGITLLVFLMVNLAPGTITGKAIFTYEGPDGNAKSVEKEFSCEVMEMPIYDDPGTDMPVEPLPEESGGLPGWAKWAIGGGCAVLLVAAVIVIRKIRKKRQAMLDLEDDDEGV